jgi:tRNA nucleotidyltransferase (CCA-adding enzyme)
MIKTTNLTDRVQKQLPAELVDFLHLAGKVASGLGENVYLVGGVVRDLLLERINLDLDLVAECDAIKLAEELARQKNGKVIAHSRFNTAKIRWGKWSVDIATARSESYSMPGALPTVQCGGSIENDLTRRDFTINAMAVYLTPAHYGELIDLYRGREDLEQGKIRVLHDYSFRDDATRIWRAVRYEQRLDFRIESHTLDLLKRYIACLDTISGDRIRHELELCLEEERPEKALLRADQLEVMERICPSLQADDWLARKFAKARGMLQPYCPPKDLYLAFLVYRLPLEDLEDSVTYLKFSGATLQTLRDTLNLKNNLSSLGATGISSSRTYRCLHQYSQNAILSNLVISEHALIRQRIELYLNRLRFIRTALTGDDLLQAGIASGPRIKEVMDLLREARLDGKVKTKEEELEMVKEVLDTNNPPRVD